MSFNFNGVNKDKVYMNGVEVTKAYMNGVEFYTSDAVYKLNFDSANQDYGVILSSENSMNIPSTGDFSYGITFKVPTTTTTGSARGLYGKLRLGTSSNRWGMSLPSSDDLRIVNGGSSYNFPNISSTYGGQVISIEVKYENTDLVLFINGIEEIRQNNITRPVSGFFNTYISAYGISDSDDSPAALRYFNGEVHSFFFGDETFALNEGSGNTITGDSGTIGTINTSNAAGIDYINANIWEEIVPQYELNLDSANQDNVSLNTPVQFTDGSEFEIELNSYDVNLRSFGGVNTNTYIIIFFSKVSFKLNTVNNYTIDNVTQLPSSGVFKFTYNSGVIEAFIDGVSIGTVNTNGESADFTQINGRATTDRYNCELKSFSLNGESFSLTEGSGNTITGSNGTTATINTSNAAGIDYIDANVWEEIT